MVFDLHIYVVKLKSNLTFGMKGKKRGYPHIQSVAKRISVCLLNQWKNTYCKGFVDM